MEKRFEFVPAAENADFVVYDFSQPSRTEIASGVHLLFAFVDAARFLPLGAKNGHGDFICTYEPAKLPDTGSDLVSKETLLPVSVRCNTNGQISEKRQRFPELSYVGETAFNAPISANYHLIEKGSRPALKMLDGPISGAWLGGSSKWFGDPLSLDASFLFQLSLDVLNRNIDRKRQMMDVASLYGFVRFSADFGPCGFCLTQG